MEKEKEEEEAEEEEEQEEEAGQERAGIRMGLLHPCAPSYL